MRCGTAGGGARPLRGGLRRRVALPFVLTGTARACCNATRKALATGSNAAAPSCAGGGSPARCPFWTTRRTSAARGRSAHGWPRAPRAAPATPGWIGRDFWEGGRRCSTSRGAQPCARARRSRSSRRRGEGARDRGGDDSSWPTSPTRSDLDPSAEPSSGPLTAQGVRGRPARRRWRDESGDRGAVVHLPEDRVGACRASPCQARSVTTRGDRSLGSAHLRCARGRSGPFGREDGRSRRRATNRMVPAIAALDMTVMRRS